MKIDVPEIIYGHGFLIWNNQHIFSIESIKIPEPSKLEASIDNTKGHAFLLDIEESLILIGNASVEFKDKSIYSFELFMNDHKFEIIGYVDISNRNELKIICKKPIKLIY